MATDQNIVADYDMKYEEAYAAWNPYYPEAATDLRFYLGDQWDEKEKNLLYQEGRSTFVFNRIRRNINLVTGYQKQNRSSSVVIPQEESDQLLADQMTQMLLYTMQRCDGYQTISDCFAGAMKTGWNLASLWVDYRDDPVNGDICIGREPYSGFITDPYLTKLDFSDCGYILKRKYLNVELCASLLPGQRKEVYRLWEMGSSRDDKFTWLPYQRQPDGEELLAYNEMYQLKWKSVPFLVDMETSEMIEFDQKDEVISAFREQYPQLKVIKKPKQYIEKHIIINDYFMRTEIDPYGLNSYPFVPFFAVFEPESDDWSLKIQSLIRCMRDPQRESNRRRSQMVDVLDSQINSGWIATENSVINPKSLFQSSQGKVIWRREDAPAGALEKIPPAQIPPSMFQLQELFDRDMVEIGGMNDASFGQTQNAGESGVMMMIRQGASILNMQDVFDNLRYSQKLLSKKVLQLLRKWKPEKFKRILNEEPDPKIFDTDFIKYDVVVQEGILTDTQRQMNFRQMMDIYQATGGAGVSPITPDMLYQAAPLQGKSQVNQKIRENQEAVSQKAQQQQQIQQQLIESQRQMSQAKAISDIALSKERFTRAVANNSLSDERAAKAVDDRASAALDRVKAVSELQKIDDERLVKYLSIIKMMEEMSKKDEEQIKEADVAIAAKGEEIGSQRAMGIPGLNNGIQQIPGMENMSQQLPQQMEV